MTETSSNQAAAVAAGELGEELAETGTGAGTSTATGTTEESSTDASRPAGKAIQSRAMRGASFLFGREAIGAVVRLIGVIITVREIGPSDYGIFTAAGAFVAVVVTICQMGTEIYLIRVKEEPSTRLNNEVFSLLLCTSLAATAIAIGLSSRCRRCCARSAWPSPFGSCCCACRSTCCGRRRRRTSSGVSTTRKWEFSRSVGTSSSTPRPSPWRSCTSGRGRSSSAISPGRASC